MTASLFADVRKRRRDGDPVVDRLQDNEDRTRREREDRAFGGVRKDVTAGQAHVTTALGNQKVPKARMFNDVRNGISTIKLAPGVADVTPSGRTLTPVDSQRSEMPLPYDRGALSRLRPDQVPRFLGTLTNPEQLPLQQVKIADLVAIQDRVDTANVTRLAQNGPDDGKFPVVVAFAGKQYIADGHHAVVGAHLRGEDTIRARVKNLEPVTNAMKHFRHPGLDAWQVPMRVDKTDMDRQMIFGWASVVTKNGVPIIDKQGDIIPTSVLEDAAYDFNLTAKRSHNDMHVLCDTGTMIESMVFTIDKQKAMGIDLGFEGWWTGWKISDGGVWQAYKRGERPEFSIGGTAIPIPVEI